MSEIHYDMENVNIPSELFMPLPEAKRPTERIARPARSYGQDAWRRFRKNKLAIAGLIILLVVTLFAIFGPMFSPYTYDGQNFAEGNQGPSAQHWFGTDKFGRDLFVRCMYGARISLAIGFVAALINMFIGSIYGGISGYFGGKVDLVMMRIVEIIYGIPQMCYVILIMLLLDRSATSIVLAMCVTYWMGTARTVRTQILSLRNEEFVLAARVTGESNARIIRSHLIPNCVWAIIVNVTYLVPQAIFLEAFLSFLGIGIQQPQASWGSLANEAVVSVITGRQLHLMFFPALLISVTVFALNFIGDGMRDALDPKQTR